jgi:HlyD family secretion protein
VWPEVETARSDFDSLKAAVMIAEASVEQSRGRLASQKAAILAAEADAENSHAVLKRTKTTLNYCTIVSPIDGVIIDRRINQGQTVVASLSTPSLFLLASDLRQLEIWVSVNEADIGQIQPKMPVRFSVDSLPDQMFHGIVKQIRLNASMSQNVVTYTVVVSVLNDSSHLLPYLTANVEFIINEHKDALCIPNSALRFEPETQTRMETIHSQSTVIWTVANDQLQPVAVTMGITDGSMTQISSEGLIEDSLVVTGRLTEEAAAQTSNPFVPKMKSNKRDRKP